MKQWKLMVMTALCLCSAVHILAEEPPKAWTNQIELGGVFTNGNSDSSLLSFKDAFNWKNDHSEFHLNLAAIRAENARLTRVYVIGDEGPILIENSENQLSAENYSLNSVYSRKLGKSLSWFAGLDWASDKVAGLESRTGISLGLSNAWIDTPTHSLSTSAGAKLIQEKNVFEPEGYDSSYPALALTLSEKLKTTKTSEYTQSLRMDMNTEETSDFRADWQHGFSVSVSTRIALKLGLQLLYDNEPAFEGVPVVGTNQVIAVPYEDLDTIFTTSIVINL